MSGFGDIESFNISLYPYKIDQNAVAQGKYITARSSPSTTLIGAYFEFENSTATFTLYEMTIIIKPPNDWLSTLRIPM